MLEGLYRFQYRTSEQEGSCICVFKDGRIAGGGDVIYYTGSYNEHGSRFSGEIHAKKHARETKPSPILGLDEFHMQLDGTVHGSYGQMKGKIAEAPGAEVQASFLRLSEL